MNSPNSSRVWRWLVGVIALTALAVIACGGAATATPRPVSTPTPISAATVVPAATFTPVPTAAATAAPAPTAVTAKDSINVVLPEEPAQLSSHGQGGGIVTTVHYDNLGEPLTWQSGDDQRIVPTGASTGWEQVDPNTWRFQLRQGVKFHNGEAFNAQAALPTLEILGESGHDNDSYPYTGPYKATAVGDFTVDLTCPDPCPIFPNTSFFLNFTAPEFLATASEEEIARQNNSFGPYKQVSWDPGASITLEAYDDYVPGGDHFEMQKGVISEVKYVFRGEAQVMMAMVEAGEADIAWDVGVDALDRLDDDQIKSGGSAETFQIEPLTIFHPELMKLKVRKAMAHAISCQEIIDSLYAGRSVCRGSIIWPGVIGATEANTAPFEFDQDLSRQLLDEAGYDFDTELLLSSRAARIPKQVEVLEAVQGYLADVGVKVNINLVDVQRFLDLRNCRAGQAVKDLLESRGSDKDASEATLEEMQAAMAAANAQGSASCPTTDLVENEPSNETLDFGRQVMFYMNCTKIQSPTCDPSPGGIQEKIQPALSAMGQDRVQKLSELADIMHNRVLYLMGFDLPVIYAVNPKLVWEPRFDRRVRINSMKFSD